ncbi:MAG TPA: TolC family protein [Longimicrobiales bacterium]
MHTSRRPGAFFIGLRLLPAFLLVSVTAVHAQEQRATLTIEEAIDLARKNNPDFQAQKNDAAVADWNVREAYGQLLPGASASTSFQYQASGPARFGIFTGADLGVATTPEYYSSSYTLGLNYALSGSSLIAPGRAKADRRATEATIDASQFLLDAAVTRQYLAVLRAQDAVILTKQELERARDNHALADARVKVGAAIPMELKQAEVEVGRAEVNLLQAENLVQTERLRLMQQLGLDMNREVELTSTFNVFEATWSLEDLTQQAVSNHPNLVASRANVQASHAGVKMARSAYLPSLSFSMGWSGYAREAGSTSGMIASAEQGALAARQQCEFNNAVATGRVPGYPIACPSGVLTSEQRQQIISGNDVFPFDYTRDPLGASLQISLPIFQGFTRERNVELAKATSLDAEHRARGEELRIKTDVATAYLNLKTAQQSVALETRGRDLASEQLNLARERYRLGAASFLELQDAVTIKARADRAYLIAVYSFHESMAALEAAVGRNLQ